MSTENVYLFVNALAMEIILVDAIFKRAHF